MSYQLRDYQTDLISRVGQAFIAGSRRVLVVASTGAGKTVIATEGFIKPALARNSRVLFIAHRSELLTQCADKLDLPDQIGIIKAGHDPKPDALIQLASIQSLARRALPPADLVIWDEAHRSGAESYQRIQAAYPFAVHIGLTATPYRGDGKGLGHAFDAIALAPGIPDLIRMGFLVPSRTFALPPPDLTGVRTLGGDYQEDQLATAMNKPRIGSRIVETYQKHAAGRSTICFAVNIEHSRTLCMRFQHAGITAEHIDGGTPDDERAAILARLANGTTAVVCNCAVLTEGFDCPRVSCIILARPTKSRCLWRQCVGRGLRPHDGKADCQIHDHAGCYDRHGHVEQDEDLTLSDGVRPKPVVAALRQCLQCYAILPGAPAVCEVCGYVFPVKPVPEPLTVDVELVEVTAPAPLDLSAVTVTAEDAETYSDPVKYYRHVLAIAAERDYKPGWVFHRCKHRFADWSKPFHVVARELDQRKRLLAVR